MIKNLQLILLTAPILYCSACNCNHEVAGLATFDSPLKTMQRDGYIAIDGSDIGAISNSTLILEMFLDVSKYDCQSNAVLFVPYVYRLHPLQLEEDLMTYAMQGVSGDAWILFMSKITAFSQPRDCGIVGYRRFRSETNEDQFYWEQIDMGSVYVSSEDNPIELMMTHYDSFVP